MKQLFFITLSICFFQFAKANDSINILSLKNFLQLVKSFHPVAKQANLQINKANAELISSRAGFDPLLQSGAANKTFDGTNYYQTNGTEIVIPTWYGITVNTGIEYLNGSRINPTETAGKTSYAGISIPLAKNLLMDKRRAALQQAKIILNASEQEKRSMVNNLLMDAVTAYWNWVQAYFVFFTYDEVIKINKKRFELIKQTYTIGERPAIDTTEALTQLQNFEYLQNEAMLNWQNATVMLSGFLWLQNNQSYNLPQSIVPEEKIENLFDAVIFPELEEIITESKNNHPDLNLYNFKLNILDVERKLKFQELLPKVDLKYNQLGKGYNVASTATKNLFDNNYRFGINFNMPLRLSQGRGDYKLAKIKIQETVLQQNNKELEIVNKVKMYYNDLVNYKKQVNILQRTYTNYLMLQRGEEVKFFNGESSLFLINSRENKALEMLLKLTETTIKYNKTSISLQWAAGKLWQY